VGWPNPAVKGSDCTDVSCERRVAGATGKTLYTFCRGVSKLAVPLEFKWEKTFLRGMF